MKLPAGELLRVRGNLSGIKGRLWLLQEGLDLDTEPMRTRRPRRVRGARRRSSICRVGFCEWRAAHV